MGGCHSQGCHGYPTHSAWFDSWLSLSIFDEFNWILHFSDFPVLKPNTFTCAGTSVTNCGSPTFFEKKIKWNQRKGLHTNKLLRMVPTKYKVFAPS